MPRSPRRCIRCSRSFPNSRALRQHKNDSNSHFTCHVDDSDCDDLDYETWEELVDHRVEEHSYCQECDECFDDDEERGEHYAESHEDRYCEECEVLFDDDEDLEEHTRTTHRRRCRRCNRNFSNQKALDQHVRNSKKHHSCEIWTRCRNLDYETRKELIRHWVKVHSYCDVCEEYFDNGQKLKDHDVDEHSYCRLCERFFDDDDDRAEHYVDEHEELYCSSCEELFDEEEELATHNAEEHKDRHCVDCDELFSSPNNYREHRKSRKHAPLNKFCGCGKAHVSYSAIILHLEAGTCRNGMDLRQLNQFILSHDRTQMFIKVSSLNRINPSPATIRQQILHAFDGDVWTCWICDKTCSSKSRLLAHVQSPAHQKEGMYECPDCQKGFRCFSGLSQHADSAECKVRDYPRVMKKLGKLLKGLKRWRMESDSDSDSD